MRLFGRKAAPADGARPALSRYGGAAIAGDWPRSYEAQVRAAYGDNAIAQRSVRIVAEAVADAPLTGTPALIGRVGRRAAAPALLDAVAAQLLLHGNAFVQVLDDGRGAIGGLYPLRPERVGAARWRLSRLLRGRRGTEYAIGGQAAGDRFALLTADSVAAIDLPVAALGSTVRVMAAGIGDGGDPPVAGCIVGGASVTPPGPAQLMLDQAGGDAVLHWTRRSRAGFRWIDGGDAPLVEEAENYRVVIAPPAAASRSVTTADRSCALLPGELAAGTAIAVRQLGTLGESAPATLTLS